MSYDALANGLVLLFLKRAGDRITNVESLQIIEVVTKKVVQALKRGFIKKNGTIQVVSKTKNKIP